MRSNKRYSNVTYTKRVDHEKSLLAAKPEPEVCRVCGAIYVDRRWTNSQVDPEKIKHQRWNRPTVVTCPACKQKETGIASGYVHIKGDFFVQHQNEIEQLLRNETERAAEDNPLQQIMAWDRNEPASLTVTTTTEHLAQRLGHALEKAFCGDVRYDFSHENKLAHVWWERN